MQLRMADREGRYLMTLTDEGEELDGNVGRFPDFDVEFAKTGLYYSTSKIEAMRHDRCAENTTALVKTKSIVQTLLWFNRRDWWRSYP